MKLLALLEDLEGPSARMRFAPFARLLEARGDVIERCAIPRSGPARWRLLHRARSFDVTLIQRRLLQPWESAWLRARARRLVADVDDALWLRDRAPFLSRGRRWRLLALLSRCDAILAGSRTLVAAVQELGLRAICLPTPAPPPIQPESPAASRAAASVGDPVALWIGQPSTYAYLQAWSGAWSQVAAHVPAARLVVLGSGRRADPLLPKAEFREWSAAAEAAALREAVVGLAPLPDDPWTRGKCAARLLTYLAAGVAGIVSPVGAQEELVQECGGALRVRSDSEAAEAMTTLLGDPARRALLVDGVAARVQEVRSVARGWPGFLAALSPGA